jgi:hypothetical protein
MSLTLKIQIGKTQQLKSMKFSSIMSVSEVCQLITMNGGKGGVDYGLFQPALVGKRTSRWLNRDKTLQCYDLEMHVCN